MFRITYSFKMGHNRTMQEPVLSSRCRRFSARTVVGWRVKQARHDALKAVACKSLIGSEEWRRRSMQGMRTLPRQSYNLCYRYQPSWSPFFIPTSASKEGHERCKEGVECFPTIGRSARKPSC